MSLYGWFKGTGPSGYGYNSTTWEVTDGLDLSGKTVLITGANSGIGNACAKAIAGGGATVLAAARTTKKAEETAGELPGDAEPVVCELSEPDSVRSCVETVAARDDSLDALIANAGIMALPECEQKYGFELQFLVNHIGHFILVTGLLDSLDDDGRVVMLSSSAHQRTPDGGIDFDNLDGERGYDAWEFYGQSKLANLLTAKKLARRFESERGHGKVANAVHPGVINTNLTRHLHWFIQRTFGLVSPLFTKSVEQGAATETWAAVHPDAGKYNGEYFVDCNVADPSDDARDEELADRLWEKSEAIVDEL